MNEREKETLQLIEEFEEALNTKGDVAKQLKLKTWSNKVDKRENIWDRLARLKQQN